MNADERMDASAEIHNSHSQLSLGAPVERGDPYLYSYD